MSNGGLVAACQIKLNLINDYLLVIEATDWNSFKMNALEINPCARVGLV